jgi:N utilization substance protein B
MNKYRRARVVAMQVLYGSELNPNMELPMAMIRERVKNDLEQVDYACKLLHGIQQDQETIDARISAVLQNWKFQRLAPVDRNILRIGTFELLEATEPVAIVINEAIEIAKEYGDKNSGRFVNGVLDKVRIELEKERSEEENGAF